ncbi:MAG: DUF6115 domain-containing protein [Candidatus Rifleibacteriota bacterium]
MWTAIQLVICFVFISIVAFWAGKKISRNKQYKASEELKAYEMSLNQLLDEMELAANHNHKVFEKQSNDLRELLTIADRKILRVNDFIKELEQSCEDLKLRSLASLDSNIDKKNSSTNKKLKEEIGQAFEEMSERIKNLADKFSEFEENAAKKIKPKTNYAEIRKLIDEEVTRQISKQLSILEEDLMPQTCESSATDQTPENEALSQNFPENSSIITSSKSESSTGLEPAEFATTMRIPEKNLQAIKKANEGSFVQEVLKMAKRGITIPQIARSLNMGKGEIELILKIYGPKSSSQGG